MRQTKHQKAKKTHRKAPKAAAKGANPPSKHRSCLLRGALVALAAALLFSLAATFFVFQQALCPNIFHRAHFCNTDLDSAEAVSIMYSDYPQLRPWMRQLKRDGRLAEHTLYADPDSTPLHAYVIAAPRPTPNTAIVVHGYKSQALEMLHIAYLYAHDMNFNVVVPDLRTHGKSGGSHIGFGWTDHYDVMRWMKWADQRFAPGPGTHTRQVVHGISMGAATTMFVAGEAQPTYVEAYVEDCGYTSVYDEIAYVAQRDYAFPLTPFIQAASRLCQAAYGWNFQQASCVEALKKADTPMLFIHGTADRYVPFQMARQLYQAKPRNKEIWAVKDVIHARSYHDQTKEYTQRVTQFINQYLFSK